MLKKYLLGTFAFILAFSVLAVSVMRTAAVSFALAPSDFSTPSPTGEGFPKSDEVNYLLSFPGRILPDSPFWSLKAARDIVWYNITTNPLKKAQLALLFSDKRLSASIILLQNNKPDLALTTLSKGEKYLEIAVSEERIARSQGYDTSSFLTTLATASLKHRQMIEQEILPFVPEDAKPTIVKLEDYSKNSYKAARDGLNDKGQPLPMNPFDGQ